MRSFRFCRGLSAGLGLASLLTVALCDRAARAQVGEIPTDRYQLRWVRESGAESCVSGAALARLLPQIVGPAASAAGAVLLLDGVAEAAPAPLSFRVRVSVRDTASGELLGERELTTADERCSALTPAVLLVLAMSVDPEAAQGGLPVAVQDELRRGRDEDVDVWPEPPRSVPEHPAPTAPAPSPRALPVRRAPSALPVVVKKRAGRPVLHAALALSAEVEPKLAPGVMLGGRLPWSYDWAASLEALAWLPRAAAVAQSPYLLDDGVDFNAVSLALSLCRRALGGDGFRLDACGGAELGVRWLSARALANSDNPWRLFFGPQLGVDAQLPLGSGWLLAAGLSALWPVRRERFTYIDYADNERLLFEPAWLMGRVVLGVGREL